MRELFEFVILYWPPKPRKKKHAHDLDAVEDSLSGEAAPATTGDEASDDGEDGGDLQAPLTDASHDSVCDAGAAEPLDDGLMNDREIRDGLVSSMGLQYGSPPPPSAFCKDPTVPETSAPRAAASLLAGLSDDPVERLAQIESLGLAKGYHLLCLKAQIHCQCWAWELKFGLAKQFRTKKVG